MVNTRWNGISIKSGEQLYLKLIVNSYNSLYTQLQYRSRHVKQHAQLNFGGSDTHAMSLFPGYIGPVALH